MTGRRGAAEGSRARRVTLRDVAEEAGVSVTTVSYVLSGRADRATGMPVETRERVAAAAERLGYTANTAARVLRRQRTELIALAYAPPVSPWLDQLTAQCEDLAAERGYSVIGLPIRRPERAAHSLRVLERGYVDGAIIVSLPPDIDVNHYARTTRGLVVFHEHLSVPRVDVVRAHERAGMAAATRYLIEQGRRRIAYLAHAAPVDLSPGERYAGYRDAFAEAGRPVPDELVRTGADDRAGAVVAVRSLLDHPDPPDALVSESDRGALAALQAAADRGIKVPDDFAVVGAGNTSEGLFASPPLTSVGSDQLEFRPLVEALFARIEDPDRPAQEIVMPWRLHHRSSA
ncbi:LacI family DNA-binding transcriptional regulator [Auraticoccus monumenti]|uniref:LacI family DNA-binding transcriptional regulator n=1 Tax=Auraticoccus monumenti TaxID=675864 RepID=UPI000B8461E5|nr:LacI family DNA-binding transcriptional regulator [Auraticoccus monumenti]